MQQNLFVCHKDSLGEAALSLTVAWSERSERNLRKDRYVH